MGCARRGSSRGNRTRSRWFHSTSLPDCRVVSADATDSVAPHNAYTSITVALVLAPHATRAVDGRRIAVGIMSMAMASASAMFFPIDRLDRKSRQRELIGVTVAAMVLIWPMILMDQVHEIGSLAVRHEEARLDLDRQRRLLAWNSHRRSDERLPVMA